MKKLIRGFMIWVVGCAAIALPVASSLGQQFPSKPIKIVVGYPAGGGSDVISRMLANEMSQGLGQSIVVENRPGADGTIAANVVAKSAADGYTIIFADSGAMIYALGMYDSLPYSTEKDLMPVGMIFKFFLAILAGPGTDARNVPDLVAEAKRNPGKMFYAAGTTNQRLVMENFKRGLGLDMPVVLYKGSPPALADVAAGRVPVMVTDITAAIPFLKAGTVRLLAITSKVRSENYPEVPTVSETALPGFEGTGWAGIMAPANTPKEAIDRLNLALQKAIRAPAVSKRLLALSNYILVPGSPEEMGQVIKEDLARWPSLIRSLGIKAE